jgi:dTDP-4-dehydrorhamnose reductase
MKTLLISTGYVGRAVVKRIRDRGEYCACTHRTHPIFADSKQFDLLQDELSSIPEVADCDTIIVASSFEVKTPHKEVAAAFKIFLDRLDKRQRLIYLSTDAVFDGTKGMYREDEIPTPANTYGKNKRTCEALIVAHHANFCIIRPSYVYGYSMGELDKRLQTTMDALIRGEQVQKFIDMFKSPMDVNQVAEIAADLAKSDFVGVVHVGGPRLSVYDFMVSAIGALRGPTQLLAKCSMPLNDPKHEYLRDTSLDVSRMMKLTNSTPQPVGSFFE